MCWPVHELETYKNISIGDTVDVNFQGSFEPIKITSIYKLKHSKNIRVYGKTPKGVKIDVDYRCVVKPCNCKMRDLLLNGCQCGGS